MKKLKAPSRSHHSPSKTTNKAKSNAISQVRIIGGQYKRRTVSFIDADGLRPTPDRLRETLFNWLLADIHGAHVLDSCAGSGVLGFEALSRGSTYCTFIEFNLAQSQMLSQSAQQLRIDSEHYRIIHGAAEQVLSQHHAINAPFSVHTPFNIVFIDPPYAAELWQPILTALITQSLINTDTLIYVEADKDLSTQLDALTLSLDSIFSAQGYTGFECVKQTKVGQVIAGLYKLTSS